MKFQVSFSNPKGDVLYGVTVEATHKGQAIEFAAKKVGVNSGKSSEAVCRKSKAKVTPI